VPAPSPPDGVGNGDFAFRMVYRECCGARSRQSLSKGKADRDQPLDSPGITRMTAITDILFAQTEQQNMSMS
jgi:hypothetical protein